MFQVGSQVRLSWKITFFVFAINLQVGAFTVERDVRYDVINGVELLMDVYKPATMGTQLYPALVYLHGGCFNSGSKANIPSYVKSLADEGFMVFSVGYRLSTVAKYPAAVTDIQQAVRFIRQNATRFQIDPLKVAAHGESAGGYLASILGVKIMPDRQGAVDQYSSRVQAVSNWYGRTDFTRTQTTGTDCAVDFLGVRRSSETMPRFVEASIITHVNAEAAVFHIMHGTHDGQVDPIHSALLANSLWNNQAQADLVFSENDGHSLTGPAPWRMTRTFLQKQFRLPLTVPPVLTQNPGQIAVNAGEKTKVISRFAPDSQLNNEGFGYEYGSDTPLATANTWLPLLYMTVRSGREFSYKITRPVGVYRFGLFFAEKNPTVLYPKQRVFNVNFRFPASATSTATVDRAILPSLDIISLVGRHFALKRYVYLISKTGNIELHLRAQSAPNALISAFEVDPIPY